MRIHLVVVRAFGAFAIGDAITEEGRVAEVLAGPHARNVVRVRAEQSVRVATKEG